MTALVAAGVAATLAAGPLEAAADNGWQEAVVSVSDLEARTDLFRRTLGFQVVRRGRVTAAELEGWDLPPDQSARYVLLAQPGADGGWIRLVAFAGAGAQDRGRIRSSAQPWEPGGWSGLNVRVRNIDAVFRTLQHAGFQGFSDPVEFVAPPFRVREAMMVGPDGLVLGLLERIDPPFEGAGWTNLVSRPVTAFAVTTRPDATAEALTRIGLRTRLSFDGPAAEPGPNLFALPHDVVGRARRSVRWWQAAGREEGTIATIAFEGVLGRSHEQSAGPPALGLFALRLPVRDPAARCSAGGGVARPATIAPYGRVLTCTIRLPDGAMLDIVGPRPGS